jgi:hypothetical protein
MGRSAGIFCKQGKEFCRVDNCLAGWQIAVCQALPPSCGATPTCNCLDKVDGFACTASASGDLTFLRQMGPDFCL